MRHNKVEHIFIQQTALIRRYLMKMGASKEDAEDIVQDAICKALEYIDAIDADKMSSWLFKVSIHRYYTLHKRAQRVRPVLDETVLEHLQADQTLEQQVLTKELHEEILRVLDALKESYRNLIIMKYFMDFSYREIGLLLGLDENAVKTYLYRARTKFKNLWREFVK
jgi:RNA polymerase sigma-70 factor (ECF subfamily)